MAEQKPEYKFKLRKRLQDKKFDKTRQKQDRRRKEKERRYDEGPD